MEDTPPGGVALGKPKIVATIPASPFPLSTTQIPEPNCN